MKFTFAVDFTSENGKIQNPRSMHSLLDEENNEYLNSIKMIGSILYNYCDKKRSTPFLGFGAITPPKVTRN